MISLSHVALLLPSVRKAADKLSGWGFSIGPEEIWDGEGTKEIYIERDQANSLLLMEPVKTGAYSRAMEKRGPSLHHIAIDVQNIEVFIESIAQTGWLLHPKSLHTIKHSKTAYLARPGFPALIEVQEKEILKVSDTPFVSKIYIPFNKSLERLLLSVGQRDIFQTTDLKTLFVLNNKEVLLEDLL